MICKIIVFVLLYCLISGKYKDYITINVPIPGINAPFVIGGSQKPTVNTVYKTVYTPDYTTDYNPVYTPVPAVQSLF